MKQLTIYKINLSNLSKLFLLKILICVVLASSNSFAGIEKIIGTITPKGTMSNVSSSTIVHEQQAGHVLGGSVSISSPPLQDLHLLNAEAPSCRFNGGPCNASIDFNAGGLSFAKGPALGTFIKQLANQAQTYGVILAVQTMCPQCENIMTWLQEAVQTVNSMAIPACKSMEIIAGGMQTAANATADAIKQTALIARGERDDMASLQTKSKQDNDESTSDLPELKSLLGDNFNLVWKALDEHALSGASNELKEFLMSLSGTVIAKKKQGIKSFTHKRSLIDAKNLAKFIGIDESSDQIEIYRCDENNKCLNPTKRFSKIDSTSTIKAKILSLITSIAKKIATDGPDDLTAEEMTLVALSSTKLINKMEQDFGAYGGNLAAVIIAQSQSIDVICYDVVTKYLAQMLAEVRESVSELQYGQLGDIAAFKAFEKQANATLRTLTQAKENAYNRHSVIVNYQDRILQRGKYQQQTIYKRMR